MQLYITTILFIFFEHINKIFTQGIPISPCPKMFQYRFDGSEWFGLLSVRNPDFGQTLHLRVTLSMRGKPTTNYLGEIELLTRGQFRSEAPVLYRVKFPRHHFPPKLLQISTNNHIVCFGGTDHSIFMTQIQLEHTRKFTFLSDGMTSGFTMPTGGAAAAAASSNDQETLLPTNHGFGTKHLPLQHTTFEKNPMRTTKDICGTIDDRIRFQVLQQQEQHHNHHKIEHKQKKQQRPRPHSMNNRGAKNLSAAGLLLPRGAADVANGGGATQLSEFAAHDDNDDDDDDVVYSDIVNHDNVFVDKVAKEIQDGEGAPLFADDDDYNEEDVDSTNNELLPSITRGAWPWLAAIYVNNLTSLAYQCGGTLVSTRVVISSAHCFQMFNQRYTANEVLVFLGRHNLKNWNEEGSLAAPVDDIYIHPDYDRHLTTYDADIAVIVLKNEVRFNTFIRPACMWSGSSKAEYIEGEHGIVVGWSLGKQQAQQQQQNKTTSSSSSASATSSSSSSAGASSTKFSSTAGAASASSTVPRIVDAPIISNEACFKANDKFRSLSSNRTFCAGVVRVDAGATANNAPQRGSGGVGGPCNGDSGAGLMIFKNNRWTLRGTVSATLATKSSESSSSSSIGVGNGGTICNVNQYVIYTDVAKFLDWIFAFII